MTWATDEVVDAQDYGWHLPESSACEALSAGPKCCRRAGPIFKSGVTPLVFWYAKSRVLPPAAAVLVVVAAAFLAIRQFHSPVAGPMRRAWTGPVGRPVVAFGDSITWGYKATRNCVP
jgi:hypothetical protein